MQKERKGAKDEAGNAEEEDEEKNFTSLMEKEK